MIDRKTFLDLLDKKILLCDGAMGTMLQQKNQKKCPDVFNIGKDIQLVIDIHLEYLNAGSEIILTNTFGSNKSKLKTYELDHKFNQINKNAVEAAREAISIYREKNPGDKKNIFIAGDIGPTGKLLEPLGTLKYQNALDIFQEQAEILLENEVDFILIETIMDQNEATAAIEAAKKLSAEVVVACTMTFGENGVTMMGNKAEEVVKILQEFGSDIVGANCSIGSDKMLNVVKKMRNSSPDAKLMFKPNAGLPILKEGKTTYSETPQIMASNIKKYLKYSPSILGACCGSTPEHIKKISEVIKG